MLSKQTPVKVVQTKISRLNEIKSIATAQEINFSNYIQKKLHLLIIEIFQDAINENSYHLAQWSKLAKDDLKHLSEIYELEQLSQSSPFIKSAYLQASDNLLKSKLDEVDREVIFCFLSDEDLKKVNVNFINEYEKLHNEIEKYITASENDDLVKLAYLLIQKKSPAFLYKTLNLAIDQVGGFAKAMLLATFNVYISDITKNSLIYDRLKSTEWTDRVKKKDLSVVLATLTDEEIAKFRHSTSCQNANLTHEQMDLFESSIRGAEKIKYAMKVSKTDLFKAFFISQIPANYLTPLIPHFHEPLLNFLRLTYQPMLLKESKKFRDQIKLEKDPAKIEALIESEADTLNQIVAFNLDFKKIANHKISKRMIIHKGSIANSITTLSNYPFSIQMLAKKTYVENNAFDTLLFLNDVSKLYQNLELQYLFDMIAYAIITKPKFNIIIIGDSYVNRFSKDSPEYSTGQYNVRNSICVAAENDQTKFLQTFIHEVGHYVQNELYQNHCHPFGVNDNDKIIDQATRETIRLIAMNQNINLPFGTSTLELGRAAYLKLANIISSPSNYANFKIFLTLLRSFANYYKGGEYSEIVVRYPEFLIENNSAVINNFLTPLANYHRNVTVKKANEFLESKQMQDQIYETASQLIKKIINRDDVTFMKEKDDRYSLSFASDVKFEELTTCNQLLSDANLNSTISAKHYRLKMFSQNSPIYIYNSLEEIIEKLFDYKTEITLSNKPNP